VAETADSGKRRFTLQLSHERLAQIDALKKEWGMRNRGDVLERLLEDLFATGEGEGSAEGEDPSTPPGGEEELDEQVSLVLVGKGALERTDAGTGAPSSRKEAPSQGRGGGIDLPGFVRRRSDQLRRSLRKEGGRPGPVPPLPPLAPDSVQQAMEVARDHWIDLYGTPASETVLEASMTWLAHDIWPQSDQSEGRAFTWTAVCGVMDELVPNWGDGPPTFERVMVAAGVLEDPFSGSTLGFRIPTLIRRFVHRFRRRPRATSFQTLEHTMTLQGALRLLQLPTDPGNRVSLAQIREAYRQLALNHHPDSGGSVETMRRLNEAYQLLKELYRPQQAEASVDPG
jgi:hypothetical protein